MWSWLQNRGAMKRVQAALREQRYADADAELDELLLGEPDHVNARIYRALSRKGQQRWRDALDDTAVLITLLPDDASVWRLHGEMFEQLERDAEALTAYDRALALSPGDREALQGRGSVLLRLLRTREALADFQKVTRLSPLQADGPFLEATAHRQLWEPEAGLAAVQRALTLAPSAKGALALKAELLWMGERWADSLAAVETAVAAGVEKVHFAGFLPIVLAELGRYQEALPLMNDWIQYGPNRSGYLRRAAVHEALNDPHRAAADRRAAGELVFNTLREMQSTGQRRHVVVIQAGHPNFLPTPEEGSALVLLTFDDAAEADPARLQQLARKLYDLKSKPLSDNPVLRAAAQAVNNDYGEKYRREKLPMELLGATIYAAGLSIYKDFLPDGRLTEQTRVLPVLAEPGDVGRIEMLPWPGSPAANLFSS